jgi:hypothetical protein
MGSDQYFEKPQAPPDVPENDAPEEVEAENPGTLTDITEGN